MKATELSIRSVVSWLLHALKCHKTTTVLWEANCGKVMRGDHCTCGRIHRIRPVDGIKFNPGKKHYP